MNTCEPHEVSLCNIHVIQNCLLLFLLRPQKRAKLITIKILKYLEPPSVVEQFWIVLNIQNDIFEFRIFSHPLFSQPLKGTPNYQHILILFTAQPCRYKVIQSNLLLTPLYIHKLQFVSDKRRSLSSSHGQFRKVVFLFSHQGSHFFETSHQIIRRTIRAI